MPKVLQLSFVPLSNDLAVLILRLAFGGLMLFNHGWGKLIKFGELSATFPDPLGVGSTASLVMALLGEVVCAVLLMAGAFTRFAALGLAVTMGVAFFMVHKGQISGPNNGEQALIYLVAYIALFFTGGGRFALDRTMGATKV